MTTPADPASAEPAPTLLRTPRDGVPPVVATPGDLADVAAAFEAGTGPVAVDAERASGYRYGQRAYLVQLRRAGAGTALIDPVPLRDLSVLQEAVADAEWILHAASQDLPCLAEVGLRPRTLFDTELAGRLLGRHRVGLGSLVETELGVSLEKGHAAADWSTRPLPEPWLRYAALDVELLAELRDILAAELVATGKWEWAQQEFAALVDWTPPPVRAEPWRRTSGINRVRQPRRLALVRALWEARELQARAADVSPGRILPDAAIVAAATALPESPDALGAVPGFEGRGQRRRLGTWWAAVAQALALPDEMLPRSSPPLEGPPPARAWRDRDPVAAARLARARAALTERAEAVQVPVENLMSPDIVRRVLWEPPSTVDASAVAAACRRLGARPWQVEQVAPIILAALAEASATIEAPDESPAEPPDQPPDPAVE